MGEITKRAGWNKVGLRGWESKDTTGNQEKVLPTHKFGTYKTHVEEITKRRERLALRKKARAEKH